MLTNPNSEQAGQGIQLFTNPTFGSIRTTGTANKPLFCLADLCNAIGIANSRRVKERLDEDDVTSSDTIDKLGRRQEVTFVTESGMYDVIIRSDSPQARPFRKWITSEVLPAIRRTGGYIRQEADDTDEDIMAKALMIAHKTIEEKKQRIQILEGENQHLQVENARLTPKAQYTDDVLQSTNTSTFTEVAKELNFRSCLAFTKRLLDDKIMFRQSGRYLPCAKYAGLGLFASRTHRYYHTDGRPDTSIITVVTEKGRKFLHEHFCVPELAPESTQQELFN